MPTSMKSFWTTSSPSQEHWLSSQTTCPREHRQHTVCRLDPHEVQVNACPAFCAMRLPYIGLGTEFTAPETRPTTRCTERFIQARIVEIEWTSYPTPSGGRGSAEHLQSSVWRHVSQEDGRGCRNAQSLCA